MSLFSASKQSTGQLRKQVSRDSLGDQRKTCVYSASTWACLSCAQFQALSTQPAAPGLLQCLLIKAPGGILNSPLLFTHFLTVFIFELYPVFKGILPSLGAREKHVLTVQGQPLHSSLGLFCEMGRTEQVAPFPLSFYPDFGAWPKPE